jgi:phage terminase small subunit
MSAGKLTQKQEAFCLAYLEHADATRAYRLTYNAARSKAEVIWINACRLRQHPLVAARIQELRDKAAEIAVVSQARVLQELAAIAFFDPITLFDSDGKLLPIHKMPASTRAAIAYIEIEESTAGRTRIARVI